MTRQGESDIAILGAGPIGLEAALYARHLGYRVTVFEQHQVGHHVRAWQHVPMFTPRRMNSSPLGRAALAGASPFSTGSAASQRISGSQWREEYLLPLARSAMLRGSVRTGARVTHVGRAGQLKTDHVGSPLRGSTPFRLAVEYSDGSVQLLDHFQVVIDASGTLGHPNWLGTGGLPALGEAELRSRFSVRPVQDGHVFSYGLPDVSGLVRQFAGQHTLLVGAGYSAATNLCALEAVFDADRQTRVTWATRNEPRPGEGPIERIAGDPLPARDQLAAHANRLARDSSWVHWRQGTTVRALDRQAAGRFAVCLEGVQAGDVVVDHVIANVGFGGDYQMLEALQLHRCYATGGPMRWSVQLVKQATADCLQPLAGGADALLTTEPGFYLLGSKLYARDSRFLFSAGLQQIRDLFAHLQGKADLDLYRQAEQVAS